jgi:acyl-CoA synthetase (AMP-forming)/AMP-acid ligase II
MNLTDLAREHGDKPAVIMGGAGATMSYAELERRSNQVAHLFRARGLRAGDRIAVLMVNELDLSPSSGRRSGPGCTTRRSTGT